jgi:hypothetical protein
MIQPKPPTAIDTLQGRIPPLVKWCLAGIGAVGGWNYAQTHGSSVAASCIVAGAATGFGLVVLMFAGMRLLKMAVLLAVGLAVVNYAVLIPFGYGDHMATWMATGQGWAAAVLDELARLAARWVQGLR